MSTKFRRTLVAALLLFPTGLWSANPLQIGRIVTVQKNLNTKTLYWIVNTPITQDDITYTIAVHIKDKIYIGIYTPGKSDPPPPNEWVKDYPVQVEINNDTLDLKPPVGAAFKVRIARRKPSSPMKPVTRDEAAALAKRTPAPPSDSPAQSLIGFDKPVATPATPIATSPPAPVPVPAAAPPPAAPAVVMGSVSVRSTPYLADVYADSQDMGYTPAKINLPPGKHTIRFEKSGYKTWSKDITVTAGSELLIDATLEHK
jgi:hypothetical protein